MTQDYIGTKRITAWPDNKRVADTIGQTDPAHPGYAVRYDDGYTSWSPKAVFEAAYHPITAMPFEGALFALKAGHKVRRAAWPESAHAKIEDGILLACFDLIADPWEEVGNVDLLADDWMIVE